MKSKYLYIGILLVAMLFVGCTKEETEPTYSVWTSSISYSDYPGTLDDGYYIQVELTNSQFNDLSTTLAAEQKHKWTEKQIYDWFIGRDFIPDEANQKTAWVNK
jgi:hypothetical protein